MSNTSPGKIILETADYIVLDKAAGVLAQKDKSGVPAVADLLQKISPQSFLAPVHRLDRNTSGLLLLAKNSASAKFLTEALQAGNVHRTYLAIVKGDPGVRGTIDAPLAKDEEANEVSVSENGKEAVTNFERVELWGASSLVKIQLETGRSHQIRAHFAHIRCPLIGDKKYAKKPWSEIFSRQALHAAELQFPDPRTGKMEVAYAPMPKDMQDLAKKLKAT